MPSTVALKVDVDTYLGTRDGLPRLLALLSARGIRAAFFVTLGPDRSGVAVRRILRKGFLSKMARTNAARMYGFRTMLYGTLLPAPVISARCAEVLRRIPAEGHEAGLHVWDHNDWQDYVLEAAPEEVRRWDEAGREAFRRVFGRLPDAQAAPAWRCTASSLALHDEAGLRYASDARGDRPFFPSVEGRAFRTLQVPTTLPTLDEAWGTFGTGEPLRDLYLGRLREERSHVLGIHAEGEGGSHLGWFADLLSRALDAGVRFRSLGDLAGEALAEPGRVPVREVVRAEIPGRAGEVCAPSGLLPGGFPA